MLARMTGNEGGDSNPLCSPCIGGPPFMRKSLRRELRRTQCEHPRRRNPMGRHPCLVGFGEPAHVVTRRAPHLCARLRRNTLSTSCASKDFHSRRIALVRSILPNASTCKKRELCESGPPGRCRHRLGPKLPLPGTQYHQSVHPPWRQMSGTHEDVNNASIDTDDTHGY